jgi:hypothetical protein
LWSLDDVIARIDADAPAPTKRGLNLKLRHYPIIHPVIPAFFKSCASQKQRFSLQDMLRAGCSILHLSVRSSGRSRGFAHLADS